MDKIKYMKHIIIAIFQTSAPLIFAMLGALLTEYTGSLAVFMEGAMGLSCFLSIIFIIYSGSKIVAFIFTSIIVMLMISFFSFFTNKYKANPFLVGLSFNMFSQGICSFYASYFSSTNTIAFNAFENSNNLQITTSTIPTFIAIFCTILIFFFLKNTVYGTRLKYVGQHSEVLGINGISCNKYKVASWTIAAFFASCAGNVLVFRLGAYSPSMSVGKGWIGILAVFLGLKKPLLCLIVVFIFSATEYATNILQSKVSFSPTLLLSFPYLLSLSLYIGYKLLNSK